MSGAGYWPLLASLVEDLLGLVAQHERLQLGEHVAGERLRVHDAAELRHVGQRHQARHVPHHLQHGIQCCELPVGIVGGGIMGLAPGPAAGFSC